MKVIISVSSLTSGGAERIAAVLANGLCRRGHQVIILTNLSKPISYNLTTDVRVTDFNARSISRCFRPIWELRNLFIREKPDIIIGFLSYHSFLCKLAQWFSFRKIPVIYSEHNTMERPDGVPFTLLERFYKYLFSKWCSAMTILTYADKKYAESKLKNLYVMPNPLALEPCKKIGDKEKVIIAVGRLSSWYYKGFDILLAAWGKISKKYPDWKLQIIGGGDDLAKDKIKQFIKENDCMPSTELIAYTNEIISYYRKASIFVLSSRYEGFGLVVTEAMSQGCACLAADYKGRQSEIITHEKDGLLCGVEDVTAISTGIERLIIDENLRMKIQINAVESSKRFLPDVYLDRWESLFHSLTVNIYSKHIDGGC